MLVAIVEVEALSIFRFTIVLLCPDSSTDIHRIISQTRDIKGRR
jgi:hypothetical protein